MKTENVAARAAVNVPSVSTLPPERRLPPTLPPERRLPPDVFEPPRGTPFPPLPPIGSKSDPFYGFKLSRMGKEDLAAEKQRQEQRAQEALDKCPPDFKAYFDAKGKISQIDREQTGRAMESLGYQFKVGNMSDADLKKELARAEKELSKVMSDPLASEADRERARAHVETVLGELDRRD